jgi:transposase
MIIDWQNIKIFIKPGFIDFRKQINGLIGIVEAEMNKSVVSDSLFVFISKDRKKIKVLYWDKTGFCLWMKRLETEHFPWPKTRSDPMELTFEKFKMMLSGVDFFNAHKEVKYSKFY